VGEHARMLDGAKPPDGKQVAEWIGARAAGRWGTLTDFIESRYPGVFERKWWFGGKKWGWSLRFKKSKAFCNLIPERGQFKALLVFGAAERVKVEALLPELTSHIREDYANATTFHDGRWVATVVDRKDVVADLERLFILKRTPKAGVTSTARPRRSKQASA
jgi:hypothetical protein